MAKVVYEVTSRVCDGCGKGGKLLRFEIRTADEPQPVIVERHQRCLSASFVEVLATAHRADAPPAPPPSRRRPRGMDAFRGLIDDVGG
jgi:hypothetical protein